MQKSRCKHPGEGYRIDDSQKDKASNFGLMMPSNPLLEQELILPVLLARQITPHLSTFFDCVSLKFVCCRFEGIETETASNGTPALSDAIAFLECRVQSRMEVPDHWVLYAEVTKGNLSQSDKKTAVHRRKMANYY